jgi:hypothetical protein
MRSQPEGFGSIWIVICNVEDRAGEPVSPRYLAAAVVGSERCAVEISAPELQGTRWPPYPTTATTLLVTIEALLRGRYMIAVAEMEAIGVPADRSMIERLRRDWPETCRRVAWHVDRGYGVLHGCKLRVDAFETWLDRHRVP